ncbi:serine hydrolase domain-containing protein [Kordiimonas aquimaris]|uniref:serine hydrolase domain-containing protein n=1 Tax=Kordiimonas aquimaris TaxID=707591 RepID=UPI0021D03326|nr:serine hydrolase domain-containing protein [Kordiimonas aquimaris]
MMGTFRIITVALATVGTLAVQVAAQQDNETALEHQRRIYSAHTIENFDDGGPVSHYVWKNFPAFYNHATIARTKSERPLEKAFSSNVTGFRVSEKETLDQHVQNNPFVDGVVVLSHGKIVYEAYPRMNNYDRHIGWSVTKVYISTALAALEHQGRVDVSKPVEVYVPELSGSAWQGISVRDIVNMASGIDCRDADGYQNTGTCIYRYEESLDLTAPHNTPTTTLEHLRSMTLHRDPNTVYEYVSPNTYVTGLIIENVTGLPLSKALQNLLWDKIGAEADGMMMISKTGKALAHSGLSARLRDIARFGQAFTAPATIGVVGTGHLNDLQSANGIRFNTEQTARHARIFRNDTPTHAAWQWDMIWTDGSAFKGGYSGQGIYIDPARDLVVAFFGTSGTSGESHDLTRIARALSLSNLPTR